MNTLSKRMIQAGLPALAIAAAPALADNTGGCPQPITEIVGWSHNDSFIQFFTNQIGDAGPNSDDVVPLTGGGGELITGISMLVFSGGGLDSDFDLVISDDDGAGAPGACGQSPAGTELLRIPLATGVIGVVSVSADLSSYGITMPTSGVIYFGVDVTGGAATAAGPILAGNGGEGPPQVGTSCPGLYNGSSFQGESSGTLPNYGIWMTITIQEPAAAGLCPADTNGDNVVNVTDLLALLAGWGTPNPDVAPPPVGDDIVNVTDLLALLAAWGACDVITNDNVENAFELCFGTVAFSTADVGDGTPATTDGPGDIGPECVNGIDPRQDIWYRFTAPYDGSFTFTTCNTATVNGLNDSLIAVYTTDVLPPTRNELIACSDDDCGLGNGFASTVEIVALEGDTFYVEIGGWGNGTVGEGELVTTGVPGAANDDCATATTISAGNTIIQDYLAGGGATIDDDDETCGGDPRLLPSLWYIFIGDNTTYTIDPCLPASDIGAGDGTDFYMDVNISVFCGNTCNPAARNCIAGQGGGVGPGECTSLLANEFSFCTQEFSNTLIRVAGEPFDSEFDDEPTRYIAFNLTSDGVTGCPAPNCGIPPPENDNFENAITTECGTLQFRTTGATTDGATHPQCTPGNGTTVNDVWYKITLDDTSDTTDLTLSTCNTVNYDSDIVFYTDPGGSTPPGAAEFVACNDDAAGCAGFSSNLVVQGVPDGDYVIRVGGWQNEDDGSGTGDVGSGILTITCESGTPPPPFIAASDVCATPVVYPNTEVRIETNTTGFTSDGVDAPTCQFGGQMGADSWWTYSVPATGTLTASTCDIASYDSDIMIYDGAAACPPGPADLLGCNDDGTGCAGFSSFVQIPVTVGDDLIIRLGSWELATPGGQTFFDVFVE